MLKHKEDLPLAFRQQLEEAETRRKLFTNDEKTRQKDKSVDSSKSNPD